MRAPRIIFEELTMKNYEVASRMPNGKTRLLNTEEASAESAKQMAEQWAIVEYGVKPAVTLVGLTIVC